MDTRGGAPQVTNNAAAEQFEIAMDGATAVLQYGIRNDRLFIYHTEVPAAFRGRGYGDLLARTALTFARDRGLQVAPLCPFVQAFIQRNPEFAAGAAGPVG